jgi:5-formyltetrahydrofolate cyclo-ligase
MDSLDKEKEALRYAMRGKWKKLDPSWVDTASAKVHKTITHLDKFKEASIVGCYMALPHEVQTQDLIATCWEADKKVCVPAYNKVSDTYPWAWLEAGEWTSVGRYDIPEPMNPRWAPQCGEGELLLLPSVALDKFGHRLGHGGGHFDRVLADCPGYKVGLAFEFQVVENVPVGTWDVPVDLIVTEENVYKFRKK